MRILTRIAWRNIWRNRTRSLVVILAVAFGLWAGIFISAFMYGVSMQRLKNILETQIGHLQVHYPGFEDNMDVTYVIPHKRKILEKLKQVPGIQAITGRLVTTGLIASANTGAGVVIFGVNPEDESKVFNWNDKLVDGNFFHGNLKHPVIIGEKLAQKLNVRLKSKVVVNCQDSSGHITAAAFRVAGIYRTSSTKFDESHVFVLQDELARILGINNGLHEIIAKTEDPFAVEPIRQSLAAITGDLEVKTWREVAPELDYINSIMDEYLQIFMIIILMAMAFGIINTMLMAVLERVREIGILMAVGMNKVKIFTMIVIETVFLTFTGVPAGIIMGYLSTRIFNQTGIDLSLFAEGLQSFDIDAVIYPSLDRSFYPELIILVLLTAILSAIYPAYKALSYKPAEAIRKI